MNFPSIDIQGSILSTELLSKIRTEQASFQQGKDFNPDFNNSKLKDEISLSWQEAKGQWTIFKSKLSRLKEGESDTTQTRNFWIVPLLTNLNYNLSYSRQSEELNGKLFPIGFRDTNIDNFPVYIGGFSESLDRRPENKQLRVSPHAMIQEYLNYSEHLYGIVTNGRQLRLLRDASRITRLSYVEFNLEKMMEEDLYSDFVILYRLLHASRMPKKIDGGAESIIEKYHQEGLEAGSTIRNKLGDAVKGAILNLANGFINHPRNIDLRNALTENKLNLDEYYRHQLRIIYRLLFLFVIEERNLVYSESKTPETKRFANIYYSYYSLMRMRKLARKLPPTDAERYYDLWQSLVSTFSLFESKEIGAKLDIMSLQGELFSYNAITSSLYDLHRYYLSNAVLLNIIKSLGYFENENGVLIAVNYGGLDVEEFGSVYEGLLELKLKTEQVEGSEEYRINFDISSERSKSGSHYTPEELVQPLIKHSLEYLIEDRVKLYNDKKADKEKTVQSLLNLKICDVACGSGHILLSAARRVSLEIARVQTGEDQPNPLALRKAMKDVVRNCIYGVDKNPLAVELCKIALWLESHNPGEPLNFLDHHIKCGDAIVGLAHKEELLKGIPTEAFNRLPGDDKDVSSELKKKNQKEVFAREKRKQLPIDFNKSIDTKLKGVASQIEDFSHLPESTPEEVEAKRQKYIEINSGSDWWRLKNLADIQTAQFFIPKTEGNESKIVTDARYFELLSKKQIIGDFLYKAEEMQREKRFFHWFLEFPEVFEGGGFDCILGNPPYLGAQRISEFYGSMYFNFIKHFHNVGGLSDLMVYFILRIFSLSRHGGFISFLSTSSINKGESRLNGLYKLTNNHGSIIFAVEKVKWPGIAQTFVSLLSIFKGEFTKTKSLNYKKVNNINSYLSDEYEGENSEPFTLFSNKDLSFVGSNFNGDGFLVSKDFANSCFKTDSKYKDVLFPNLSGIDLNNNPKLDETRWIINFKDWEIEKAKKYEICFKRVQDLVFPFRQKNSKKDLKTNWWLYERYRKKMYDKIENKEKVLVRCQTGKFNTFVFVPNRYVYDQRIIVFNIDKYDYYAVLNSCIHESWVYKFAGSVGGTTINYSPNYLFETFSFPNLFDSNISDSLSSIARILFSSLVELLEDLNIGLTKIYNLYHLKNLSLDSKHVTFEEDTISFDKAIEGIVKLRELHLQMDNAVLKAYGWSDVELRHDFYEVDYLPENDRVRFTIHPEARKEILKRLLELNHKIHDEEVKAGLWDKKKAVSKKSQSLEVKEPEIGYGLFDKEK